MDNVVDKKFIFSKMPKRQQNSNKSSFGRILNIAGSKKYKGSAYLSSASALKTGAGYVTLASVDCVCESVSAMLPEVAFYPLNSTQDGSISNDKIDDLYKHDVISAGCGITQNPNTKDFLVKLLNSVNPSQKIVLDADGINIVSCCKDEVSLKNVVITPHPKELARFLNVEPEEIINNREKYARIASQAYGCITLLKGHNTVITNGDEVYINPTGNSSLAKAGTGDVLTGIIAGFMAQKVNSMDAAILGAYVHGLSAQIISEKMTQYCVLASDVIEYLPSAFTQILSYGQAYGKY